MRTVVLTVMLTMGVLVAGAQKIETFLAPGPEQMYAELRRYLELSDAQLLALDEVQKSRSTAEQAIYEQINEKQQALNALLRAGSTDAARVGQLLIEINTLRKQLPLSGEPYRSQALNVLTAAQKSKLGGLTTALELQSPAYQAVNLNLIDAPQVRPLPVCPGGIEACIMEQPVSAAAPVAR